MLNELSLLYPQMQVSSRSEDFWKPQPVFFQFWCHYPNKISWKMIKNLFVFYSIHFLFGFHKTKESARLTRRDQNSIANQNTSQTESFLNCVRLPLCGMHFYLPTTKSVVRTSYILFCPSKFYGHSSKHLCQDFQHSQYFAMYQLHESTRATVKLPC